MKLPRSRQISVDGRDFWLRFEVFGNDNKSRRTRLQISANQREHFPPVLLSLRGLRSLGGVLRFFRAINGALFHRR